MGRIKKVGSLLEGNELSWVDWSWLSIIDIWFWKRKNNVEL